MYGFQRAMLRVIRDFLSRLMPPSGAAPSDPLADLTERYTDLTDTELYAIVTNASRDYENVAISIAAAVIRDRGANRSFSNDAEWITAVKKGMDETGADEIAFDTSTELVSASRMHEDTRSPEALEVLRNLAASNPRCADPLIHLAAALRRLERANDAEFLLIDRIALVRRKSVVAALLGELALVRGAVRTAVYWYVRAIALSNRPSWAPVLNLAGIYAMSGRHAEAVSLQRLANKLYGRSGVALDNERSAWLRSLVMAEPDLALMLQDAWRGYLAQRIALL